MDETNSQVCQTNRNGRRSPLIISGMPKRHLIEDIFVFLAHVNTRFRNQGRVEDYGINLCLRGRLDRDLPPFCKEPARTEGISPARSPG